MISNLNYACIVGYRIRKRTKKSRAVRTFYTPLHALPSLNPDVLRLELPNLSFSSGYEYALCNVYALSYELFMNCMYYVCMGLDSRR